MTMKLRLIIENTLSCGPVSVMGDCYVKQSGTKKQNWDVQTLYGASMSLNSITENFFEIERTEWHEDFFFEIIFKYSIW